MPRRHLANADCVCYSSPVDLKATMRLPNDIEIDLEEFNTTTLGKMIELAGESIDDPNITVDNFGPLKYFFFVNPALEFMIDNTVALSRPLVPLELRTVMSWNYASAIPHQDLMELFRTLCSG